MHRLSALLFLIVLSVAARAQSVTVTPGATTYASTGGTISLGVALRYSGALSSLGFQLGPLPAGWSYVSSGGSNIPQITPVAGDSGTLGFAYTSVPTGGADFTFTLSYSAGLVGTQTLGGIAGIFRPLDGASQRITAAEVVLAPAGSTGPGNPVPVAPAILTQPVGGDLVAGQAITLSVVASGTAPLTYQWRKDNAAIAGATAASYAIAAVTSAAAGSYTVVVGNSAGSAVSAAATITVRPATTPPTAPQIVTAPADVTVAAGATATFSVTASGTAPLLYQWRRDGAALAGATLATLALANVQAAQAGTYSVVVANSAGAVTSAAARLTVTAAPPPLPAGLAGTYFGTFGGTSGTFALQIRSDRTGVLLAYARAAGLAIVSREVRVDAVGNFSVTAPSLLASAGAAGIAGSPPVAAAAGDVVVSGSISAAGVVTGTVGGTALTISAPAPGSGNGTAAVAGFYQAGAAGSADSAFVLVGESGAVYVLTNIGGRLDAGRGTVGTTGAIEVVTEANARVGGVVAGQFGTLTATVTPVTGPATTVIGANPATRTDPEKLVNISTRSPVGGAAGALFAGFVIAGNQPKPVLVRAIGPTLASFGVQGALAAATLEVFRGETAVAAAGDWGAGGQAAAIAAAAVRVGAFALPASSRDSAALLTLAPGAYTAVVRPADGSSGVGLVEVYDATEGAIPPAERIVNVSTRSQAGSGDASLIAGFNVRGTLPKRVLIRGIGPGLAQFGVTGVLARPQLEIYQADAVLARNSGWGSVDALSIAAAAAQVGAFALTAGSSDAALLMNLLPGAYTVHVSGLGGTTGSALIEVYEVP